MKVAYDSYPNITRHLVLLERHTLNGDVRNQIECLDSLAGFNVGVVDDRISSSLDHVKLNFSNMCVDSGTVMKFVRCLHKFGDSQALLEVLPHFSHEFAFMSAADVVRLTRIYAINCRDSDEFKEYSSKVLEYMRIQLHDFSLDDRLSCLLSCSAFSGDMEFVTSVLISYVDKLPTLNASDCVTLKTILCALRLYSRTISRSGDNILCGILDKSFGKVLECLASSPSWRDRDSVNVVARISYLLSSLCRDNKTLDMHRLFKIVWQLCEDGNSSVVTVKSSLYMLYSMRFMPTTSPDLRGRLLRRIQPDIPKLTISEMTLLLECVDKDTYNTMTAQFTYLVSELNPPDFVRILKFYAKGVSCMPPLFAAQLKERFCVLWKDMAPCEFSTSFNCFVSLQLLDRSVLSLGIRYIYDHSVEMGPKAVAQILHAFGRAKFYPPRQVLNTLCHLVHRDIDHFDLDDLARCMSFAAPLWRLHTDLFTTLLSGIEGKLDTDIPSYNICSLAVSLRNYRNRRFNALLYSAIFASIKTMTVNQLCLTFRTFAKSGLINRTMSLKLCHYILRQKNLLTSQDVDNLIDVINLGYCDDLLHTFIVTECNLNPVQRFIIDGGDIDVDKLSDSESLQCIYAVRDKPKNDVNNSVIKRLCARLKNMAPGITPRVASGVLDALEEYGYMKPKICRILTNRIVNTPVIQRGRFNARLNGHIPAASVRSAYAIFRRIELGPPHFEQTKV
ncbi:hypothetical protein X943_000145 [Babesia divergens]|uniref:Uncharacterized protein n=1 Tax=Babesia divergens TaxID=32595 RepID=A0AAD9GIZ4_BABDI|nr:hypothetical protein X943_000145 [Babesia divergens]